ncbi:MAG: hypothetical protein IKT32_07555, partial [Clostridia bacterium]|nr:hypothetical protein [Clostridia bacterium]
MKLKHYWFSITLKHLEENNVDFVNELLTRRTIKKWAYIIHDKDVYTKNEELENPEHKQGEIKPAHVHVYVNFGDDGVNHELVANWFKINPHSVKKILTNASNCLLYFVHGTKDAIADGKFQYSWGEVKHSANWDPEMFTEQERFENFIGHFDDYSYKQQIEKIHSIKDSKLRIKLQKMLDDSFVGELKYRSTFIDRFVQVMFVTGGTGTGKTTFARQFVEKLNYFDIVPEKYWRKKPTGGEKLYRPLDYAVSGSSNDVFENYKGEDVFILDDMRDDSFSFTDLLKFLDNHTNSPIKSRFANKCFFGVLIIITSEQPLSKWYRYEDDINKKSIDRKTLKQLYRRISNYVVVKEDKIFIYDKVSDNGEPTGDCKVIKNNTGEYYKDKPKPINVGSLICNAFGEIEPEVIKVGQVTLTEVLDEDIEL